MATATVSDPDRARVGLEAVDAERLQQFRAAVQGETLRPGEPGYDAARGVWNGMIDRRPGMIVRCSGPADVIAAVDLARENDLLVAVRGGGHNVAGTAVCDGGLVIDLSAMRGVRVDPAARTARVAGGATWGDVDRETQVFGLAAPGGVVSTTGVAGLTLGGGLGWARRAHGLSCDNLVSVDIVTADGAFRVASETQEPDLFWAIRGGGGNFGVVTSFEFRLHPVGPEVYLCAPAYAADRAEDAAALLRAWRDLLPELPDEVSAESMIWTVPPAPDFPVEAHGRQVVVLPAVSIQPLEEAERTLRPMRELGTLIADLSHATSWVDLQTAFDGLFPAGGFHYYWKSLNLDRLDDDVIERVAEAGASRPSPSTLVNLWQLGGAMARVPAEATAFAGRDVPFMLSLDATWADPAESERNIEWTRRVWSDMHAASSGGVYLNFPGMGEEGEALVRASYGANHARLAAAKRAYDPGNLFRMNQNIAPSP